MKKIEVKEFYPNLREASEDPNNLGRLVYQTLDNHRLQIQDNLRPQFLDSLRIQFLDNHRPRALVYVKSR